MSDDELELLRFLAELPQHVESEARKPQAFPFQALLSHQYLTCAIASRFSEFNWRATLDMLYENGFLQSPASFRTKRVMIGDKVANVVTMLGHKAIKGK